MEFRQYTVVIHSSDGHPCIVQEATAGKVKLERITAKLTHP